MNALLASPAIVAAIAAAIPLLVAALIAGLKAAAEARRAADGVVHVHDLLNSRLTQLLDEAREVARLEAHRAGAAALADGLAKIAALERRIAEITERGPADPSP